MSNLYTVTTLTTGTDYPYVVAHDDYQGANKNNEAMSKWHHESSYKRNVGGFFKCYIEDEDGKIVKADSSDVIGASESRIFTLLITVETKDGVTTEKSDFDNFNSAMMSFHDACESKIANKKVLSYIARIENEWGGVEVEESFTKGE